MYMLQAMMVIQVTEDLDKFCMALFVTSSPIGNYNNICYTSSHVQPSMTLGAEHMHGGVACMLPGLPTNQSLITCTRFCILQDQKPDEANGGVLVSKVVHEKQQLINFSLQRTKIC